MGGGNSKQPVSRVTEQDKAVLVICESDVSCYLFRVYLIRLWQTNLKQMKQMRDKLKKYRQRIETKLEGEKELARQLLKEGKVE